ncbi:MAG: hypothetical protein H0U98_03420 [Alphaproteobacteria bacterium]|nr:hypothetical protein [Alphaproteobacteria bacterium]
MRTFLSLLAAAAISLAGYFLLFGFVVSRPLVVDQISALMDKKLAYAAATPHPKLFIVAGSNARFSHSCAAVERVLHRPCVNMGIAADVALDWTLDRARAQLAPGDLVYLPLEYDLYSRPLTQLQTGMDAAYRFRHDKASLTARGPEGMVRAAFMFSLPTLVHSIGEMGLKAAGVARRFNVETLDRQGDETGHDGAKADPYVPVIRRTPQVMPDTHTLMSNPDSGQAVLGAFLDWCRAHHVQAVGGLPTIFNDRPLPDAAPDMLRSFYAAHGAGFMVLPNRSQYPRADFYDSAYHLRESAQTAHSQLVAQGLRPFLSRSP